MNRTKKIVALLIVAILSSCGGCINWDVNGPDRGVIPNVTDPIKPPSLTNEWGVATNAYIIG